MKERWLEAGIFIDPKHFDTELVHALSYFLKANINYSSWHFFVEPNYELRFRILLDKKNRNKIRKRIKNAGRAGWIKKIVFRKYNGEVGLYGERGFDIAKGYFQNGADTAQLLVFNEKDLISPYKKWSPLHFHLNRYVHLFANQLGMSVFDEFKWAVRYAWNRLIVWVKYRNMKVKGR